MSRPRSKVVLFVGTVIVSLSACAGTPSPSTRPVAGWYSEHDGVGRFQPCGRGESRPIAEPGELRERAQAFGLQPDTPVYVKLQVQAPAPSASAGGALHVEKVVQFGSPTPVRNCPMTGMVIRTPAPPRSR